MSARRKPSTDAPGQDSFLDIVANLVGILIILVMVVGVRAKDAMLQAAPSKEPDQKIEERLVAQLDDAKSEAKEIESDTHRLDRLIKNQQLDIDYRRKERDRVLLLVKAAEAMIADRRQQLDADQQARFDAQRKLIAAQAELDQVQHGIEAVRNSAPQVQVLEHLPTPMAKTVFGKELHFRLRRGRLTFVPWDELVEELQNDAPQKLWRLKDQPELTETVGPIGGFWLKYTIRRIEKTMVTKEGDVVRKGVELDHFVLQPVAEDLGEPISTALGENSDFRTRLAQYDPRQTTVTVWTYPHSYNEFRTLKKELFELGFLTASRPLPDDQPMGGSPNGSRSSAQ